MLSNDRLLLSFVINLSFPLFPPHFLTTLSFAIQDGQILATWGCLTARRCQCSETDHVPCIWTVCKGSGEGLEAVLTHICINFANLKLSGCTASLLCLACTGWHEEMQFNEPVLWKGHKISMHFHCMLKKHENLKHCQAIAHLYPWNVVAWVLSCSLDVVPAGIFVGLVP